MSGAANGKYYCFRVTDKAGNHGYGSIQANLSVPTITLTQDQDSVDGSATISGSTIDSSTWAHTTPSATDPTCSNASYNTAGSSENTISITSADNNKYVCFRVRSTDNIYGYGKHRIDYNPPVVTVSQVDKTLTATSSATDLPTTPDWRNSGPLDAAPTCSSANIGYSNTGNTVTPAIKDKYYCFRVTDRAGNHGYGSIQALATASVQLPPTQKVAYVIDPFALKLKQWQNTVTASGLGLYKYGYVIDRGSRCDGTSFEKKTAQETNQATNLNHNDWVCFRARADAATWVYANIRVNLSSPIITTGQDQTQIVAVARVDGPGTIDQRSWQSSLKTTKPVCGPAHSFENQGPGARIIAIDKDDKDAWACFRVQNSVGTYGYHQVQIDLEPAIITLTQDDRTVVGKANESVTWLALVISDKNCGPETDMSRARATNRLRGLEDGDRVCFRAHDDHGNISFASLLVDLTRPNISLTQDGTTVTASGSGLSRVSFFDNGPTDPTCDSTKTTGWTGGSSATNLDDNDWVCFRGKNSLGVYGYAEIQVDLTAPQINLSENDGIITATGQDLSNYHYKTSDSVASCNNGSGQWTKSSQTDKLEPGTWVCFRAQNDRGVWGYQTTTVSKPAIAPILTTTATITRHRPQATTETTTASAPKLQTIIPAKAGGSPRSQVQAANQPRPISENGQMTTSAGYWLVAAMVLIGFASYWAGVIFQKQRQPQPAWVKQQALTTTIKSKVKIHIHYRPKVAHIIEVVRAPQTQRSQPGRISKQPKRVVATSQVSPTLATKIARPDPEPVLLKASSIRPTTKIDN